MPEIGETLREARMRAGSTSPRSRRRRRSAPSTCARSRTRSGTCCPGPPSSRRSCARTRTTSGSTRGCWSRSTSQRYERPSTQDLTPFGPRHAAAAARGARRRASLGPWLVVVLGVVVLLGRALRCSASLGRRRRPAATPADAPTRPPTATPTPSSKPTKRKKKQAAAPTRVALQIVADRRRLRVPGGRRRQGADRRRDARRPARARRTFRAQALPRARSATATARMRVDGKRYRSPTIGDADRLRAARRASSPRGCPRRARPTLRT